MAPDSSLSAEAPPVGYMRRGMNRLFGGAAANVFRGMATLALGSGIARLIGIAATPVITRLYSPEDFGVLSVFAAAVAILAPILTLRYVLALPLPRHDGMAMNLLVLSVVLMLGMTLLVTLLLWGFGEALLDLVSMEVLAPWWWLITLGMLGAGSYELLTMWATRRRAYKPIARTHVFQSAAGSIVKIVLGLLPFAPIGLLIGQVVSSSGGTGSLSTLFWREFRDNWRHVRLSRMCKAAVRHRGFPIYRLPSQVLLIFSTQAPILFTATLYDAQVTGQLGLALMALALPMNLLGASLSNAYYAEISIYGKKQPRKILEITALVQKRLFLVGVPAALVIFSNGEELFSIIFGSEWQQAGSFCSILSVYLLFQLTSAPLITVLNIFDKQRVFLVLNLARSVFLVILFLLASGLNIQVNMFITAYSLALSMFYIFVSFYIIFLLRQECYKSI